MTSYQNAQAFREIAKALAPQPKRITERTGNEMLAASVKDTTKSGCRTQQKSWYQF